MGHPIIDHQEFCKLLLKKTQINVENADTLAHALSDVSKSFDTIYNKILPKIINENDGEKLIELFWDIREEFRHVQYHINDAKLTELHYVKEKR